MWTRNMSKQEELYLDERSQIGQQRRWDTESAVTLRIIEFLIGLIRPYELLSFCLSEVLVWKANGIEQVKTFIEYFSEHLGRNRETALPDDNNDCHYQDQNFLWVCFLTRNYHSKKLYQKAHE